MKSLIEKSWNGIQLWQCPYCNLDFREERIAQQHLTREHLEFCTPTTAMMVTNRPDMAKYAALQFQAQSWGCKRLLVVSSFPMETFSWSDMEIDYVQIEEGASVGYARNLALRNVHTEVCTHWDDDEIYHPRRTEAYVTRLLDTGAVIGGVERHLYSDGKKVYRYDTRSRYLTGATLTYRTEAARRVGFKSLMIGEDLEFVRALRDQTNWTLLPEDLQISLVHDRNTSRKDLGNEAYIEEQFQLPELPHRILLATITWEDGEVGIENILLLASEVQRWRSFGVEAALVVADSGSSDGYRSAVVQALRKSSVPHRFLTQNTMVGANASRNAVLEEARKSRSEYVFFSTADISVIPWSTISLTFELAWMPDTACLGLPSEGFRSHGGYGAWPGTSRLSCEISRDSAWSQYGVFRARALQDVYFDQWYPFSSPGYGLEDVGIAWELESRGWKIRHFSGISYLRRQDQSTIRKLLEHGYDAADQWYARMETLRKRWGQVPEFRERLSILGKPSRLP